MLGVFSPFGFYVLSRFFEECNNCVLTALLVCSQRMLASIEGWDTSKSRKRGLQRGWFVRSTGDMGGRKGDCSYNSVDVLRMRVSG